MYAGAQTQVESCSADGTSVGHSRIDNTDLRCVGRVVNDSADVVKLPYGLTIPNDPTAQDVWSSTPAFGFPFTASPAAVRPVAGTPLEGARNCRRLEVHRPG